MIIVEGADNTGKTTLAQAIAKELGIEYRRPPTLSSTHGPDDAVPQWWEDELKKPPRDVDCVYDRCFFISDPIYRLGSGQPLLRSEAAMEWGIQTVLNRAYIIFCLPDWAFSREHLIVEHSAGQGLNWLTPDRARLVHWAYHCTYMLYRSARPTQTQRYTPPKTDGQFAYTLERLKEWRQ